MSKLQKNLDKLEHIMGQLKAVLVEIKDVSVRKSQKGKNHDSAKILIYPV